MIKRQQPILAVLAICVFAWGAYTLAGAWSFSRTARRVDGLIVDRNSVNFTAQYTVNGQMLRLTQALPEDSYSRRHLRLGISVGVLYDPARPARAKWEDDDSIWSKTAWMTALAFLIFLGALFPNVMTRRIG